MSYTQSYLHAMGITHWIPRDSEDCELASQRQVSESQGSKETSAVAVTEPRFEQQYIENQTSANPTDILVEPGNKKTATIEPVGNNAPVETTVSELGSEQLTGNAPKQSQPVPSVSESVNAKESTKYLIIPRGKQWQKSSLTVICRHEPGQPSESYLLRGQPSKTVANLLRALNHLVYGENTGPILNTVNLAQLASTALSDDSRPAHQVFQHTTPRAILVMGAAAANQLLGQQRSIGEWQLKPWHTPEGIPVVVTYHPFEIFNSPILKKQVQKDLYTLANYLKDE